MTKRMQDAEYVKRMAKHLLLQVPDAPGFHRTAHMEGSAHAFAESISRQKLACGHFVVVKPPTYTSIEWTLDDFRDVLGLHGAGIVQVQSKPPPRLYRIHHVQVRDSMWSRTDRTNGHSVYGWL